MEKAIKILGSIIILPFGLLIYWMSGLIIPKTYSSLVFTFCITSGKINDWLSKLISIGCGKIQLKNKKGILGDLSNNDSLSEIVNQIREKGYVVFPGILPEKTLNNLINITLTTEAMVRKSDLQDGEFYTGKYVYYGDKPNAIRYDYLVDDLLKSEDVQDLISDESLLAVAQSYLRATPLVDVLSMWWHTNFSDKPDSTAAQYFHFDMDRIKWLKVFIYLTDVGPQNGPHYYIEGTHKANSIPSKLLDKGYVRLMDYEVSEIYNNNRIIEFVGKKGTVIIEDTRGLHKGGHVVGDPRLILQLQFSNSLFGADQEKYKCNIISNNLLLMKKKFPVIFKNFSD